MKKLGKFVKLITWGLMKVIEINLVQLTNLGAQVVVSSNRSLCAATRVALISQLFKSGGFGRTYFSLGDHHYYYYYRLPTMLSSHH